MAISTGYLKGGVVGLTAIIGGTGFGLGFYSSGGYLGEIDSADVFTGLSSPIS
ncbi:hypothetical protein [Candidatus Mycoplasma haematohominis]|uniref:hypothetical protein n=1 Tax=Candidatus Mycoplasma haematohominis TaxID=1494318 RepID=UPI001C0A6AAB|nr:hypothetical protein [Candidatus Mycoplasma haemohominis]